MRTTQWFSETLIPGAVGFYSGRNLAIESFHCVLLVLPLLVASNTILTNNFASQLMMMMTMTMATMMTMTMMLVTFARESGGDNDDGDGNHDHDHDGS